MNFWVEKSAWGKCCYHREIRIFEVINFLIRNIKAFLFFKSVSWKFYPKCVYNIKIIWYLIQTWIAPENLTKLGRPEISVKNHSLLRENTSSYSYKRSKVLIFLEKKYCCSSLIPSERDKFNKQLCFLQVLTYFLKFPMVPRVQTAPMFNSRSLKFHLISPKSVFNGYILRNNIFIRVCNCNYCKI